MRTAFRLRLAVLAAVIAVVSAAAAWPVRAGAPEPGTAPPAAGLKAEPVERDEAAPRAAPGMTPWGAVILSILMLSSSSLALYGGRLTVRVPRGATTRTDSERPSERAPQRAQKPLDQPWRRRRGEQRREARAPRRKRTAARGWRASSQSKKRRLGAGCRGPLRNT